MSRLASPADSIQVARRLSRGWMPGWRRPQADFRSDVWSPIVLQNPRISDLPKGTRLSTLASLPATATATAKYLVPFFRCCDPAESSRHARRGYCQILLLTEAGLGNPRALMGHRKCDPAGPGPGAAGSHPPFVGAGTGVSPCPTPLDPADFFSNFFRKVVDLPRSACYYQRR